MSIKFKLIIMFLIIAITPMIFIGAFIFFNLDGVLAAKIAAITDFPMLRETIMIMFLIIFLVGSVATFFAKVITEPLRQLTDVANKIENGDLQQRAKINSKDEVGMLSKAFNSMADELIHSQHQLLENLAKRRKAEEALITSEEMSRSIIETANDAFISIDEKGVITQWNTKAEEMFGWLKREVVGRVLSEIIIPQQHRNGHEKGIERYLMTGESTVLGKTIELKALRRDDQEFPIEMTLWTTRLKEKHQFHAFVHDITNRKRGEEKFRSMFLDLQGAHEELKNAQAQLVQSEKLASIGHLAAGVAHEINNPIGFVSSNIHTLEEYVNNYLKVLHKFKDLEESVKVRDQERSNNIVTEIIKLEEKINIDFMKKDMPVLLDESKKGLERVKKIILDLRTFAREDQDEMEYYKLEEVIDSILSIVHNEIKYKVTLKKEYADLPLVKCNTQKLGQVFINLLINAAHAIEDKGAITIKTFRKEKRVCVAISDTGSGIEKDKITKIFDPFFTTKPVGEGTGMGLSISYEIVRKHGGDIQVESEPGKGSTFTVMLPLTEQGEKNG